MAAASYRESAGEAEPDGSSRLPPSLLRNVQSRLCASAECWGSWNEAIAREVSRLTSRRWRLWSGDIASDESTISFKFPCEIFCSKAGAEAGDVEDTTDQPC
jgi:hypothetical protein